jgi:hypothetical protein
MFLLSVEKDIFLDQISYFNFSTSVLQLFSSFVRSTHISVINTGSYKWWSRVPKTGVNNIIIETWPGVRSHHSAVILQVSILSLTELNELDSFTSYPFVFAIQAAIPYNLPVDNPNGTMVWENSSISATNHFVTNGWTMYNRYALGVTRC